MGRTFLFSGPHGDYTVAMPDGPPLEDKRILVDGPQGQSEWSIETAESDVNSTLVIAGMTHGIDALWFELRVGQTAEIQYWGDRILVRADTGGSLP